MSILPIQCTSARTRASRLAGWLTLLLGLVPSSLTTHAADATPPAARLGAPITGLPLAHNYPFGEIGDVSPGVLLNYDSLGRLTVIQEGAFIVFDDKNWTDVIERHGASRNIAQVGRARDGITYYGASGSWGRLEHTSSGTVEPHPFHPDGIPTWVSNTKFEQITTTTDGVYFAGTGGVVYRDLTSGHHQFHQLPQILALFSLRDEVFVTSYSQFLMRIDVAKQKLTPVETAGVRLPAFEKAMPWDEHHVLVKLPRAGFALFDGREITPWPCGLDAMLSDGVSAMEPIAGGRFAVAVKRHGLFLLDAEGRVILALTGEAYANIADLCAGEPGVLWASTAEGVKKLLYDTSVSVFDHRLGLDLRWPQVAHQGDKVLVVSDGRIYESLPGTPGDPTQFRPMDVGLREGVWSAAATTHGLLLGNSIGVHHRRDDGASEHVLEGFNANRLVMLEPDVCLVIGEDRIAALRWQGGHWREFVDRIPGIGFASVVLPVLPYAIWMELGVDRVGRVTLRDDGLHAQVFDKFPWKQPVWVNLGAIGPAVVLTHADEGRIYFDETTGDFRDRPDLERLLRSTPYPALRPRQDARGVIWMSHARGLFRLIPEQGGYRTDVDSLSVVRDNYPEVQIVDGADVWISGNRSLLHVRPEQAATSRAPIRPILTAVVDARKDREIFNAMSPDRDPLGAIPYGSNSLNFHFFSGTYALLRSPSYQFKIDGYSDDWSVPSRDATISLTTLHEGDYRMSVRLLDSNGPLGEPTSFTFSVAPPWFRTPAAYAGYAALIAATLLISGRWLLRRVKARNTLLEARAVEQDGMNAQLRASMAQAQQADRTKSQFLANMSHELRTPMNGVIGMSNLLIDTPLQSDQREYAETIRNSAEALLTVLNDILDFSKMEAGKLRLEIIDFNLGEAIEESVELLAPRAAAKRIELASLIAPGLPTRVRGDPGRLRQILLNLLGNAVKFTETGEVIVRLHWENAATAATSGEVHLSFEIQDSGVGIPPAAQAQLFQSFNQADNSTTRRFGGTGLGLAISRQIVQLMGGKIGVRSALGSGSTFWFTIRLPIATTAAPRSAAPAGIERLRGLRVLAVDNNETNLKVLQHHVHAWGLRLSTARDCRQARDRLKEARDAGDSFRLVVTDHHVLETEGALFTAALAEGTAGRPPPVILLTSMDRNLTNTLTAEYGIAHSVKKPIRAREFLQAIPRAITSTRKPPEPATEMAPVIAPLVNAPQATTPAPLRILVVEDHVVNQRLVQLQLRKLGFKADCAVNNGLEALEALELTKYDLILMDCQMPEMDGYEATRRIREGGRHPDVRIVAMTANAMQGDREKCLAAGMDEYIAKPIREQELRTALAHAVAWVESRERISA